jgi:hypothetical protein
MTIFSDGRPSMAATPQRRDDVLPGGEQAKYFVVGIEGAEIPGGKDDAITVDRQQGLHVIRRPEADRLDADERAHVDAVLPLAVGAHSDELERR